MPYIDKGFRARARTSPVTAGELNYAITYLIEVFLISQGDDSYTNFNTVLGALEGAKLEFYRRVVVPYEEKKREENGDVYRPRS